MSKPLKIEPIATAPKFMRGMAQKINALIKAVRLLSNIKGDGSVQVKYSDSNILITLGDLSERLASLSGRVIRASTPGDTSYSGIKSAIEGGYSAADLGPVVGDVIELHDSGDVTHIYYVAPDLDVSETTIPGQSGSDTDRVKVTARGSTRTAYRVNAGEGGSGTNMRTFRGAITIATSPHPTTAEIETAIQSAYGASTPSTGDVIVLTSGGNVPFFARAIPQDPASPATDFGLNYRNITVNSTEQRFLISQTGTFF